VAFIIVGIAFSLRRRSSPWIYYRRMSGAGVSAMA